MALGDLHKAADGLLRQTCHTITAAMTLRLFAIVAAALSVFVFCPAVTSAQTSPTAQWITSPSAPANNVALLHFRKELELKRVPEHFFVDVSADNRFLFEVNQKRVGAGPARGDLAHWRYEVFDLAPFLHVGKNVLTATVWNLGTFASIAQISNRTGFLVRGEGAAEQIANTIDSWWVEEDPALKVVAVSMQELQGYYAADPNEILDGRLLDWNWDAPAIEPARWKKAVSIGRAANRGEGDTPNNWQLVRDALPAMEYREEKAGRMVRSAGIENWKGFPEDSLAIAPHQKVSLLVDHGELTTAYANLLVSGGKDSTIRLTYAEALKDAKGEKGNRNEIAGKQITGVYDEFIADGGENRLFSTLVWRTWRYLQLDIETHEQPLQLLRLTSTFSAFPFEQRARFAADDPSLSRIWDVGWRTARLDAHETYMDTPYWEQLQYIGDTRIQALISYVVAGDDRLARQAIEAFDDSRIPDGITLSRYPTHHFQAIPPFSLLWVGMLHDFAMYRADPEFVRAHLPGTRDVLDWFSRHQQENGMLGKLPWWNFIDWADGFRDGVPPHDESGATVPVTLHFVMALREAAELENVYGDEQRAKRYLLLAAKAAESVRRLCSNEKYGLIADTSAQDHFSQHSNFLAVLLDVIPASLQRKVLIKSLDSERWFSGGGDPVPMEKASYYYRFYLARALDHAGMGDRYLELLTPWKQMLELGLTTWAEKPEPTRSDSHAWSSHPNYDLLTIVAGIHPAALGFEKVVIEPRPGSLKNLSVTFPWKDSSIRTDYKHERGNWSIEITLPPGLQGELLWLGQRHALHSGSQSFSFPEECSSQN